MSTRGPGNFAPAAAPNRSPQTGPYISASLPGRSSKGGIYQLTKLLEKKHGAFFISRLILASGINLRGHDSTTPDDPAIVMKFIKTLRNMLSPTDMAEVLTHAPSLLNSK